MKWKMRKRYQCALNRDIKALNKNIAQDNWTGVKVDTQVASKYEFKR